MRARAGRSNSNERGSSYDRRARRTWLLSPKSGFGGDGEKVPCWECGAMVNIRTMIVDRINPGEFGGRYTRANIRPHCVCCSGRQGQTRATELRCNRASIAFSPYGEDDLCVGCGRHYATRHTTRCPQAARIAPRWR